MINILKVGHILSFLIGMIVGSGAIWEYQKIEIEKQKIELDKIQITTDLRKELDVLMEEILKTTGEFIPLNLCSNPTGSARNKAIKLHTKLDLYKQNFDTLENKIALIEGRGPRDINLMFSAPCAPTALPVTVE